MDCVVNYPISSVQVERGRNELQLLRHDLIKDDVVTKLEDIYDDYKEAIEFYSSNFMDEVLKYIR